MSNNIIHKAISYILILVLLFPLGITFSHVMDNHGHDICIAKKEKHIHSEKINCSYLHYFTNIQSQDLVSNFSAPLPNSIYKKKVLSLKSFYFLYSITAYLVRGPPTINVL